MFSLTESYPLSTGEHSICQISMDHAWNYMRHNLVRAVWLKSKHLIVPRRCMHAGRFRWPDRAAYQSSVASTIDVRLFIRSRQPRLWKIGTGGQTCCHVCLGLDTWSPWCAAELSVLRSSDDASPCSLYPVSSEQSCARYCMAMVPFSGTEPGTRPTETCIRSLSCVRFDSRGGK